MTVFSVKLNQYLLYVCALSALECIVKVGPPVHNYEHEAGSYGDGFT